MGGPTAATLAWRCGPASPDLNSCTSMSALEHRHTVSQFMRAGCSLQRSIRVATVHSQYQSTGHIKQAYGATHENAYGGSRDAWRQGGCSTTRTSARPCSRAVSPWTRLWKCASRSTPRPRHVVSCPDSLSFVPTTPSSRVKMNAHHVFTAESLSREIQPRNVAFILTRLVSVRRALLTTQVNPGS